MDYQLIAAVAILFAASLTRSTFGFGEALVAMPLLSMVIGLQEATAVVGLTLIINSIAILATSIWRDIEWDAVWRLTIMTVIGVPIGVLGLLILDPNVVKLFLAAIVISFAIYNLRKPRLMHLTSNTSAFGFGLVSGILGGAYNTIGPPLVIFATLRQWPTQRFRTTLQAVFLPTGVAVASVQAMAGLWEPPIVFRCLLFALPAIILATILGKELNRRLDTPRFSRYVCILLLLIGALLLFNIAKEAFFTNG